MTSSSTPPAETLRSLEQSRTGYQVFLAEQGSLTQAAYKLASLKLEARGLRPPPQAREVHVAACEIHARTGSTGSPPTYTAVASEIRSYGLALAGES